MQVKHHTPEQLVGQRGNQKGNKKYLKQMEMETKCLRSVKAVLRVKFIVINDYIKKKERSQVNIFIPQETRKRVTNQA